MNKKYVLGFINYLCEKNNVHKWYEVKELKELMVKTYLGTEGIVFGKDVWESKVNYCFMIDKSLDIIKLPLSTIIEDKNIIKDYIQVLHNMYDMYITHLLGKLGKVTPVVKTTPVTPLVDDFIYSSLFGAAWHRSA